MERNSVMFVETKQNGTEVARQCRKLEQQGYIITGEADDGEYPAIMLEDALTASLTKRVEIQQKHDRHIHNLWTIYGDMVS